MEYKLIYSKRKNVSLYVKEGELEVRAPFGLAQSPIDSIVNAKMEMNHSQAFWKIVASVLPDYQERKRKLKLLQRKLHNERWN